MVGKNLSDKGVPWIHLTIFPLLGDLDKCTGQRLKINYPCIQTVLGIRIKDNTWFDVILVILLPLHCFSYLLSPGLLVLSPF